MGRALLHAARGSGLDIVGAWSRTAQSRDSIAAELELPVPESVDHLIARSDLVFVAVADDALPQVLDELASSAAVRATRPLVLVTSGAMRIDELPERVRADLRIARLHPLQTVTPTSDEHTFDGVVAAITAYDDAVRDATAAIATRLGMRPFPLVDEHAATWHVAGALASGAVATLVAAARDLAVDVGVDPALALEAVAALAARTVERCAAETPEQALTGPVVRGDAGTVAAHVATLEDHHPELVDAYRALSSLTVSVALDAGRIDGAAAARIEHVLEHTRAGAAG
jgi:predicted short-subunit dehydrogenase-like oxidoreductase (DUF2520 family)